MTIDTLEVRVAALQRLPETGSESQVGCTGTVAATVTAATTAPASSPA